MDIDQKEQHQKATHCYLCKNKFTDKVKIIEHCHWNGEYRGAACISCNTKEGKHKDFIPIYFHNLSGYDANLFIQELAKQQIQNLRN